MEKLRYIDTLDKDEKQALYSILDALVARKRLKDTLPKLWRSGIKKANSPEEAGFNHVILRRF